MRISLVIILCVLFSVAKAQTYGFKQYSEENGLKQSYIYCISQSPKGYLVLSNGEALNLFDGSKFTELSDSLMAQDIITTHFIDSRNIIWLGHQQNGLSYVKNGKYIKYNNETISNVRVSQIKEDDKKRIWLATNAGLFFIGRNSKPVKISDVKTKNVFALCFDKSNRLLIGTDEGLTVLSLGKGTVEHISELKDKNIKQIIPVDATGTNYWVLADGGGIYFLTNRYGKYEVTLHLQKELKAQDFNITCIYSDRAQNLWISVFGDGLRKISFDGTPGVGKLTVSRIDHTNGLKSENIQSIFQDEEGNMWFGTFGDGLIKKPVELFSFFGVKEGIEITDIKKVAVNANGNIWMGTTKGLAFLDVRTNTYTLYNSKNGFIDDRINALLLDSAEKLWIGTGENGIFVLDIKKRKFTNFSKQKQLDHLSVNTILGSKDRIMFGTTDGLYIFHKRSGEGEEITTSQGLLHNNVLHLFEDSKGRVWISSHGSPPYYIQDQKVIAFKKIKGLNSFKINAVCEDKNRDIWIATDEDGVFKFNEEGFLNYTVEQGLLSNFCNGIETDGNNSVWVAHSNGLSELKEGYKRFTTYTDKRGLLFYENNFNAVHKCPNSSLWFGTSKGIVRYNPESNYSAIAKPSVFISKAILNNTPHSPGETIKKKYGNYNVHIDFNAISLSEPEAIYYKYRLLPGDTNWIVTPTPYVDFPKIGDGDYVFEVLAYNANTGLSSSAPAYIAFGIEKPIWKRTWFYVLMIISLVIITSGIIFLRTRSLLRDKLRLESIIDQKTHLLKKEKEAIEGLNKELAKKNMDITDSINYAKRIQDSLLPPDELLNDLFYSNYFVLYKPKDIVSGDFYWCNSLKRPNPGTLHLAAVIDCTGHGVPGAFLSILANDFLKQLVVENDIHSPADMLDFLDEHIASHLNQTQSKLIDDGMDIALIGIDYEKMKLYYSGANNPAYIYRRTGSSDEEIVIQATKRAIGSSFGVDMDYQLHIVDLKKGDVIYLSSDGYSDQFGGADGSKKMSNKRFRQILSEACTLPMDAQKEFIETRLMEWKRNTEQTDDICVMGIKV
jgi:ligand-binding sensor domain-containing protein/serine phosphatase RsbU (regulator of sigma subunit)